MLFNALYNVKLKIQNLLVSRLITKRRILFLEYVINANCLESAQHPIGIDIEEKCPPVYSFCRSICKSYNPMMIKECQQICLHIGHIRSMFIHKINRSFCKPLSKIHQRISGLMCTFCGANVFSNADADKERK